MRNVTAGLLLMLLVIAGVEAKPEYAVRYNQTCALCHVNPTGSGMRTTFGSPFFSYTDLPMNKKEFAELQELTPMIGEKLQYGLDLRGLYAARHALNEDDEQEILANEIVQMQANFYLSYAFSDATRTVFDVSSDGLEEAYALYTAKNGRFQARGGRFRTSYGWNFDDHTLFVRRFLGFGSLRGEGNRLYDSGFEAGYYTEKWDLTAAMTNGEAWTLGNALYSRIARRVTIGELTGTFGVSGRVDEVGAGGFLPWMSGAFYGASIGRWTILGETDLYAGSEVNDETVHSLISSHMLRYKAADGIYINGWYEYYDPDVDLSTGYAWRGRIGVDLVPFGYMSVSPMYEWTHESWDGLRPDEYGQFLVQGRLWL